MLTHGWGVVALRLLTGISPLWQLHLVCETRSFHVSSLEEEGVRSFGDSCDPVEQGLAIGPAGWHAAGAEYSTRWDAPASSLWLEEGPVWYKGLLGTRFRCPGKCRFSRVSL